MDGLSAADEIVEALNPSVNYQERGPSIVGIKRVSYTHDGMVDLVIGNPGIKQREIAAHFGYTEPWVSQIFASDAFQERLAARKNDIIDPTLRLSVEEHIRALLNRSLAVLDEKLHKPAAQVSDQLAIRAAEFGARALGLGRVETPKEQPVGDRLVILADRLIVLKRAKENTHEILEGISERLNAEGIEETGGSFAVENKPDAAAI